MSQGFQVLLDAEKEASKIVQKARAYRVQKLKDSKVEAQREIEELKQSKQLEYEQIEKSFHGSNEDMIVVMKAQADASIEETRAMFEKNKENVIQGLLSGVMNVEAKVHRNALISQ